MEALDDRVKRAVASATSAPSPKPELVVAAKLIEGSAGCAGLAVALEELARCDGVPDDMASWIARHIYFPFLRLCAARGRDRCR